MENRLLSLLRLMLKYNSTDLHFDIRYQESKIEMRVEGSERKIKSQYEDYKLVRYLMYLSNLDVSNFLTPQTGQFEMEVDGQLLSLRFAVIQSSNNATSAVLRILNTKSDYEYNEPIKSFANAVKEDAEKGRAGLYIISGPTGCGKTTLAYNILKSLKNVKAYSAEDPIECYIDSIVQLQTNEVTGMTMSECIKQILRHDPTIIFVGEIRDSDTAKISITAANTGHVVLATMHASDCESTITKMKEYGVNESHLNESLKQIINLRLVHEEDGSTTQPAKLYKTVCFLSETPETSNSKDVKHPNELTITDDDLSSKNREKIMDMINEYLCDNYGSCSNGYGYEINIKLTDIDWDEMEGENNEQ